MFKGLRFEMIQFHMWMSDHSDIQNLWSPSQELSENYTGTYTENYTEKYTRVYTTVQKLV